MLDTLNQLDQDLLVYLNGLHNSFWDYVMVFITHRLTWIPLYLVIIVCLIRRYGIYGAIPVMTLVLLAVCTDSFTSAFMKPFFERLRPCHNPDINHELHLLVGCGGKFGFASSHAANTFGIAFFLIFLFRQKYRWIWNFAIWAAVVSYSRIYLAKHYPGDIIVGALVGLCFAWFFAWIYNWSIQRSTALRRLKES